MLLIEKLTHHTTLTLTEKRIADYIVHHIMDIPKLSISELAKNTYASHSAVVRLCKKLGYSGFRELKTAASEVAYTKLHTATDVNVNFPFDENDTAIEIAKKMADLTINTIKKTMIQLEESALEQATDMLQAANHIYLFARGDSQIRARSFQNKLVKLNKLAIIAEEYADEAWNATNLTPQDCAIFITYSGTVPLYKKVMHYLHEQAIPILLLTGNLRSPLIKCATLPIITVQEEYDFAKVATFSSQTAFEYILGTLFASLYARDYKKNVLELQGKQELLQTGLLAYPGTEEFI
ncbi:MurR/RpiR family transcriptional regulator [Enterococcus faecalis]